jgi:hypothetical protein
MSADGKQTIEADFGRVQDFVQDKRAGAGL